MALEFDSILASKEKLNQEAEAPNYSAKEQDFLGRMIRELNHAWNQRQQSYTELDDMTYDQWYIANKKAGAGYIPPKTNRRDVRTVSGTTREKTNTLLAAILKHNFSHSIEAYDEDNLPDVDLGTAMADMVTKSRLLEHPRYDVKRPIFLQELITQGTTFFHEVYNEHYAINKEMKKYDPEKIMQATWDEKVEIQDRYCDTQLVPAHSVYLGNIREFHLEKQPFMAVVRKITRAEAESLYGKWSRWKNVPLKVKYTIHGTLAQEGLPYQGWQLTTVGLDMVEEINYYNKWTNTFQKTLNGVMMLPVGFPLQCLTGRIEYPVTKADLEPISPNFAYSRGIPAKTKFNQALMDEMFKAIILKTRKSYAPPIANNSGRILSKRIFDPGTVHNNIDPDKLKQIGENGGITGPEMTAIEYVKRIIDESSINPLFEGQRSPGEQTAKEISELQKQSLMRLGVAIVGIINMETDLVWKRMWNILKNWTEPIDVNVKKVRGKLITTKKYRTETVESEFEDGSNGQRIIDMQEGPFPDSSQVQAEEELLTQKRGVPVRKIYVDPLELQKIKHTFFVKVTPTEKDPSELKAIMFEESMAKAMQFFPESINRDYIKQQWAVHQKLDPRKMFLEAQPQNPMMPGGQPGAPGAQGAPGAGALGGQVLPQTPRKPSLKTLQGV